MNPPGCICRYQHKSDPMCQWKQDCTCTETCARHGRPFPSEWSWRCKALPYLPREIDQSPQPQPAEPK